MNTGAAQVIVSTVIYPHAAKRCRPPARPIILLLSVLFCLQGVEVTAHAASKPVGRAACLALVAPPLVPSPIDLDALAAAVVALKTTDGRRLLGVGGFLRDDLRRIFDPSVVKTKSHQFYRLLHLIARLIDRKLPSKITVNPATVRSIILIAQLFDTPLVANAINKVTIERAHRNSPRYHVRFSSAVTEMPLNGGRGFYAYTHGFCQHTTALLFYQDFAFTLERRRNGNIVARRFRGVDFYGRFGNRGIIDVDFEYVALAAVEFFAGSAQGKVTAGISATEFKKNRHNPLLYLVTRLVKNSSVQALGW